MTGTWLNLAGIVLGITTGLIVSKPIPERWQLELKRLLGAVAAVLGLKIVWDSVEGSFLQVAGQIFIALLALSLGNFLGAWCRLQTRMNRLGKLAKESFARAHTLRGKPRNDPLRDGFITGTIVFALTPLAFSGAALDGTVSDWRTLALKAGVDTLAAWGFARVFGPSLFLAVIPVFAFQGAITQVAQWMVFQWPDEVVWASLRAVGGLILAAASLVILGLGKVPLANSLPALVVAPCLAAIFR